MHFFNASDRQGAYHFVPWCHRRVTWRDYGELKHYVKRWLIVKLHLHGPELKHLLQMVSHGEWVKTLKKKLQRSVDWWCSFLFSTGLSSNSFNLSHVYVIAPSLVPNCPRFLESTLLCCCLCCSLWIFLITQSLNCSHVLEWLWWSNMANIQGTAYWKAGKNARKNYETTREGKHLHIVKYN